MLPIGLLNSTATVKRRVSLGRDSLNNPTYGEPTEGSGWRTIYECIPVRYAFSSKPVQFSPEGERLTPNGTVYYNPGYEIQSEDRILTPEGTEYVVVSVVAGRAIGPTIDHYEAVVQLP